MRINAFENGLVWTGPYILHYRPFLLNVFRHDEREVVETVCLVYFAFDFLEERPGVQPERERSQSCSFGPRKF